MFHKLGNNVFKNLQHVEGEMYLAWNTERIMNSTYFFVKMVKKIHETFHWVQVWRGIQRCILKYDFCVGMHILLARLYGCNQKPTHPEINWIGWNEKDWKV